MAEVGVLRVSLGLDSANFTRSLAEVNRKLRAVDSEFKAATAGLKGFENSLEGLRTKSDALTRKLQLHEAKVQELKRRYEESAQSKGKDAAETEKLLIAYNKAVAAMKQTESQLRQTNQAIEKQSSTWTKLQTRLNEVGQRMQDVGGRLQSAGQGIAMSFGAVTTAIGGALGFAVKKSMDFEAQIDRVGAVAGATPTEIKKLEKAALDLGASTSKSATEVAQGMEIMAAMGYNTNQILAAMPGIIAAAEASGEDMAMVAETVSAALNAFGLEASEASRVADVLAQAANDSAAGIQDMQYTFKYAAPVAKQLGISLEQLAAATEIMSNAGIKGEQAGTTLRAALIRLSDPPREAANTLEALGVKITDANGKMLPFSNIIGQLAEKTKNMANAQKLAALSAIFGTEAASGMLTVVEAGPQKLDQLTKSLQNSGGASQEAAKKMKDNLKGSLEELQGAFETAQITIGNALAPAIQKVAEVLQGLINWFNQLSPATQKFIAIGAAVAAVLTGIVAAIGVVLAVIGGAVSGLGAIASAFGIAGGAAGLFSAAIAAITGPIGIAVGALVGLTAGGVALYKHFKQSSIEVDLFGKNVSQATQKAVGGFLKLNDEATKALNQLDWSGQVVTQNIANNIISTFDKMGNQVLAEMKKDHQAELTELQNLFSKSSALTAQEEANALAKLKQHQQQEQTTIQQGQQRIVEILNKAKEQKRSITDAERQEINQIQQQMVTAGIQHLSKNELEAKSILERMRAQAGKITAQQAAEVVRNSKKQKDEAIKEANQQYDKVVQEIIRQRDEVGSISKEQADKLIKEAKRQHDEAVKKAIEMHNSVVSEAKKQAGEHVNQVNWETGQVLSKWEVFKNDVKKKLNEIKQNTSQKWEEISKSTSQKLDEIKAWPGKKLSEMNTAIQQKMAQAKTAIETGWNKAKSFLQNIDLRQIGKDIIQGLINGISSMASAVAEKVKSIANSVTKTIRNVLDIHSPSRETEKLGKYTGEGFAKGIESKKKDVEKSSKKTAEAAKKAFNDAFAKAQTNFKLGKIDSSQYISELRKIQKEYAKLPDQVRKVQLEIKKIEEQRAKEQAEIAKKQFEDAKKAIEDKKVLGQLSLDQELKMWQNLAKKYKAGSKERIEIEKEIVRVKDELLKQQFEKEKEYIDKRKYYNDLSLKEELQLYENYIKKYKAGTEQREYYEREIYRVKKEINDKLLEANNEYAQQVKEINERLQQDELKAKEEYEQKVKEINDRLAEDERKLTEEYEKAVDDRTKALYSFAGIFDEIKRKDDVTGQGLLKNLSDQVSAFKDWQSNISSLAARGIDEGLLQELQDMGPKAVDEIAALNSLSDEELQQYVALWREKNALARTQATNELEGMRLDTQMKIQQLRSTANAELEQVRIEYINKIAQLRAQAAAELEQHKIEWMTKVKEITEGTKTELNLMSASMSDIGKNSMQGLIDGLNSMMGPLQKKAKEIANTVRATIQSALDIHSPSRVMMELGKWIPAGLAEGIERNINAVVSATNRMAQAAIPTVPNVNGAAAGVLGYGTMQTNNIAKYGNVYFNVTIPVSDLDEIRSINDWFDRLGMKVRQT